MQSGGAGGAQVAAENPQIPPPVVTPQQAAPAAAMTPAQGMTASMKAPARKPAAGSAQTRTAAASSAPQAAAAPAAGGEQFVVQVAARQRQTDALAAFADMQQRYPGLLNSYRPFIQRADLGTKGIWYRLRVGPMNEKTTAANLCEKLKSAGMPSCHVHPHTGS
jgi:cell division septation protein DedD